MLRLGAAASLLFVGVMIRQGHLCPYCVAVHAGNLLFVGLCEWKWARSVTDVADDRPVVSDREAKSISHETTFATDLADIEVLRAWLLELTEHVGTRLRQQQRQGRTVNLKLRFADFHTITRTKTLPRPTAVTQDLWQTVSDLRPSSRPAFRQRQV